MKISFVQFLFFIAFIPPLFLFSQEDSAHVFASIDKYTLNVEIDAGHRIIQGEARMQVHLLKDSVSHVRFAVPSSMTLHSVRDSADKKFETAEEPSPSSVVNTEISVAIPDTLKRGDVLLLKFFYEEAFDSLAWRSSFISPKEILLSPNDTALWWPVLFRGNKSFVQSSCASFTRGDISIGIYHRIKRRIRFNAHSWLKNNAEIPVQKTGCP